MAIHRNLTELIGNTPLVELTNYERNHGIKARIVGKVELNVSSTSGETPGKVSVTRYFVDPDLLKTVLSSTTESGETDTAI